MVFFGSTEKVRDSLCMPLVKLVTQLPFSYLFLFPTPPRSGMSKLVVRSRLRVSGVRHASSLGIVIALCRVLTRNWVHTTGSVVKLWRCATLSLVAE